MNGTMNIMDQTGHSTTSWDPAVPAEVEVARETFNKLVTKGYQAFKVGRNSERGERLKTFDPQASQMIMVPQLQGG